MISAPLINQKRLGYFWTTPNYEETPLHDAAFNGHAAVAALLLDRGAEVNSKTNDGWTPLYIAAGYGHAAVAALLLDRGAEVNSKDNGGWTPLHDAALHGYADVTALLLDRGAEINSKTNYGRTPLQLTNNQEIKNLLIKAGAEGL